MPCAGRPATGRFGGSPRTGGTPAPHSCATLPDSAADQPCPANLSSGQSIDSQAPFSLAAAQTTGTIMTIKAMYELERTGGRYGLMTMCIGGGQGIAMVIERC